MVVDELIYVGDPMCSWCWGFAPELDRLSAAHPEIPLRIVVGGLRPGPASEPMSDRMEQFLAHHWQEVAARSGQPFDHTILQRRDWVYDTEPACRAVVSMRELAPESTFPFFARIQRAFYAEGTDVTQVDVYPSLLDGFDVDTANFMEIFEQEASRKTAWQDFATARQWGITGFPTLLARTGTSARIIARGYTTADRLEAALAV